MSKHYRQRAERALGHPLPPNAIVHHHVYGDLYGDAGRDVLVICQDHAYHRLLHQRMRERGVKSRVIPSTDLPRDVELLPHATCLRCGYVWAVRTEDPATCARCRNPRWNQPRKPKRRPA
jgi:hypothetical protein